MSDPLRTDPPRAHDSAPDADRDAKIEQLLLAGLDHYFSGNYDQAINIWTRALFLDRSHPRARAYIERARTAQAERQRETDELLQSGLAAFERGESVEARRLLQSALGRGAPADEALAVLDRLDRLEHSAAQVPPADAPHPSRPPRPVREAIAARRSGWRLLAVSVVLLGVASLVYVVVRQRQPLRPFAAPNVLDMLGLFEPAEPTATPDAPGGLALPRRGDAALARAQTLQASGKLHDALTALDAVRLTDPQRADADRLRAEIQRQLISVSSTSSPARIP